MKYRLIYFLISSSSSDEYVHLLMMMMMMMCFNCSSIVKNVWRQQLDQGHVNKHVPSDTEDSTNFYLVSNSECRVISLRMLQKTCSIWTLLMSKESKKKRTSFENSIIKMRTRKTTKHIPTNISRIRSYRVELRHDPIHELHLKCFCFRIDK